MNEDEGYGWLTFASIVLVVAGVMRFLDGLWAIRADAQVPDLEDQLLGEELSTYGWLYLVVGVILILAGIAPVLCVLSSAKKDPQAPIAHVNPNLHARNSVPTSVGSAVSSWSTTPSETFIGTCLSAIIEAGESEPSCSLPYPSFMEPDGPSRAFSCLRPLVDGLPSRVITLPLRC